MSLLPNKCALPPLCADPVHLSEIPLHTRAPVLFQVMSLVRDQHIASTPTFFYGKSVAFLGILWGSPFETVLRSDIGDSGQELVRYKSILIYNEVLQVSKQAEASDVGFQGDSSRTWGVLAHNAVRFDVHTRAQTLFGYFVSD